MTGGRKTLVNFNVKCYIDAINSGYKRQVVVKFGGRKTLVPLYVELYIIKFYTNT